MSYIGNKNSVALYDAYTKEQIDGRTATTEEAEDAVSGTFPDSAGVHAAFNQYGLGNEGNLPIIQDLDDPSLPSGLYTVTPETVGTRPASVNGMVRISTRVSADNAQCVQEYLYPGSYASHYIRRATSGSFSIWVEQYHSHNILGTVSQSSGTPTGAIIERGSNSNGDYVKFADGTMIAYIGDFDTGTLDAGTGVSHPYPVSFVDVPATSWGCENHMSVTGRDNIHMVALAGTGEANDGNWYLRNNSSSSFSLIVKLTVIGRWF